jgi:DNA-binding MarR family transcriptional regulator
MAQETRWLSDDEQRAWLGFRVMTRSLDARLSRELARDGGLSMQDYDVLSALSDAPRRRRPAKDLGDHLLWTPSRLSHHLDRMERRGLVRRESGAGRGTDVVLTPEGLKAIRRSAPGHVAAVRRLFIDRLSPETLAALTELNDAVVAALDEDGPVTGVR